MVDLKCEKCGQVIQKNVSSYNGELFCDRCKSKKMVKMVTASSLWEKAWQR